MIKVILISFIHCSDAAKKLSNTATTDIEAGINLLKGAEMSYPAYYCNVLD